MAQAATITVNDRKATPVAHNYAPRGTEPGMAMFIEPGTVPLGDNTLTVRWRKGENGRYYMRLVLSCPVVASEVVGGATRYTTERVALVDATFRFDATSTEAERADVVGMFANALAASQTVVNSTIVKLEGIW